MSDRRKHRDKAPLQDDLRDSRNITRWMLSALAIWAIVGWFILSLVPSNIGDTPAPPAKPLQPVSDTKQT